MKGSLGPVGTEQGSGPPRGGRPAGAQAGRAPAGAGFRPGAGLAPPESSLKLLLIEAPVLPAPLGSGGSSAAAPPSSESSPSPRSSGLPGPVLAPRAAGWAAVTQEGSRPWGREASWSACAGRVQALQRRLFTHEPIADLRLPSSPQHGRPFLSRGWSQAKSSSSLVSTVLLALLRLRHWAQAPAVTSPSSRWALGPQAPALA